MPKLFWQGFGELETSHREFNHYASQVSEEITDTILKSERLICECRKVIAKADKVLERDRRLWSRI